MKIMNGYLVTVDGKKFRGSSAILNRLAGNFAYKDSMDRKLDRSAGFASKIEFKFNHPKALDRRDDHDCDENCEYCRPVYNLK